ncbi:penicillin-binding protein 1A [Natranaerovirga hydrolytica]|uniref:Penicillin-binding protein 1A n=1 Tax=Natranaerovirga hydrolytica TaxID=680378 RepID=A0A4R1MJ51_9FIRM|nr:PBP1A family penicillin-binding protein [Natranaerovirga hydrolytica]TCK92435.1 penicillin-binding protein 1A [Natranaerovirga hydrolytica]
MNYSKDNNTKKQKQLQDKKKKVKNKFSLSFLRIFIVTILLLFIVGVGATLGAVKGIIDTAPSIEQISVIPEGYSSVIYDQNGNEIVRLVGEHANRIYVDLDMMPEHLPNAFVAIEDERFWAHNGIDLKGIMRAVFVNLRDGALSEGASTITQQLLKNNVFQTNSKTFDRKIQEQYLAIQIEQELNKEQILEYYLNTIGLGSGNLGVQAAAKHYFNKDVSELTIAESASLAAITQRPEAYHPVRNPENNRQRQLLVLAKMLELDYITQSEYDSAVDEDIYARIQTVNEEREPTSSYSYFVDEVIKQLVEDLVAENDLTETQAYNLVYRGGLSIYTTQDLDIQKIVDDVLTDESFYPPREVDYFVSLTYRLSIEENDGSISHYDENTLQNYFLQNNSNFDLLFRSEEIAQEHIDEYKEYLLNDGDSVLAERTNYTPQPQASMTIIDYHTGHVKAIAGGRGEKQGNLTLNRATGTTRQPGSTFKVLASFLPALDSGESTLASVFDDVPHTYPNGRSISNWYSGHTYNYKGLSSMRQGIAYSMNIVAVKALEEVTPRVGYDYIMDLGFTTVYEQLHSNNQVHSDIGLPLALGGLTRGVTNLELTAAYGAIANNGMYVEPIFYTRVLDHDGRLLLEKTPETRRVMKETTSFLLTNAMQDVLKPGIGTASTAAFRNINMPAAGKTGTTSSNYDRWFSGYTPYYAASVWIGHDINTSMNYSTSYHNIMWREVMERIHTDLPHRNFETPSGIVTRQISTASGLLAVDGVSDRNPRGNGVRTEYFAQGTEPTEYCDVLQEVTICTESGLLATEYCPDELVESRVYIVRPDPLEPSWAESGSVRIEDAQYEMPTAIKEGQYCDMHDPSNFDDDSNSFNDFLDDLFGNNGNGNGNGNNNGNDDENDEDENNDTNPLDDEDPTNPIEDLDEDE